MEEEKRERVYEEDEIDLYELWQVLIKRKKLILTIFVAVTSLTAVVSFLLTPVYRSEASLMPISSQPTGGIAQMAGEILGIPLKTEDTSAKIMAVLESRTIKERVIRRLGLVDVLLEEKPEDRDPLLAAVELLEDMVNVSQDRKTGLITLGIEYKEPDLARKIAQAYIEELQKILEEKALTVAKVNRIFLEKQLSETEDELKKALERLAHYQKKEKVIVPQEQVKGALELYAQLLSQKVALQVELRKLESILSSDSPRLISLKEQIKAIESQLSKLETSGMSFSALPSLEKAPEQMAGYARIFIKVKGLQAKYEAILKLYEQAKLEERKENIYVEVIDPPSLPDTPVKPKKKLMVAVAGTSSFFLGIFFAFFLEWLESVKRKHEEDTQT